MDKLENKNDCENCPDRPRDAKRMVTIRPWSVGTASDSPPPDAVFFTNKRTTLRYSYGYYFSVQLTWTTAFLKKNSRVPLPGCSYVPGHVFSSARRIPGVPYGSEPRRLNVLLITVRPPASLGLTKWVFPIRGKSLTRPSV